MSHYDWMYEDFLLSDVELELSKKQISLDRINKAKRDISGDLSLVKSNYSLELLSQKIEVLERDIQNLTIQKEGWERVKEEMLSGKRFNYEQAHARAQRR